MFVCRAEQLEAFKKHMEAGETNTSAIIMGEENEDETENGQLNMLILQHKILKCVNIQWHFPNLSTCNVMCCACRREGGRG